MFSTGFTLLITLHLFPLSITFFVFLHGFNSISSNLDEVLSISISVNVFAFRDFNIHHKDGLTYSGGTDRPGELCYFSISNNVTWMANFPTQVPDCSTMAAFPPLGNSHYIVILVTIDFPLNHNGMPPFIA